MKKVVTKKISVLNWNMVGSRLAVGIFVIMMPASIVIADTDSGATSGAASEEYEDTGFGEYLYNESSDQSKIEIVDLLEVDKPSVIVFLQAISMGLGIDEVLDAAVRLDSERRNDFTASAASLLPVFTGTSNYEYGRYDIDTLDDSPYRISEVAERFFESRDVLVPFPDWHEGQYHFNASAKELNDLIDDNLGVEWYRSKSKKPTPTDRPVFVSLYEASKDILVDGEERVKQALKENPEATIPVVFIFNRLFERSIDNLGYPKTIKGVRKAYLENAIMVTPTPEWEIGEYHTYAQMSEIQEVFELPEEDDFEPEEWQALMEEAENHIIEDESFLIVVLPAGDAGQVNIQQRSSLQYAANGSDGADESIQTAFGKGLIVNRPERLAALAALGVQSVPISFYYLDRARIKPYKLGLRGLQIIGGWIPGTNPPPKPPLCASPPCR